MANKRKLLTRKRHSRKRGTAFGYYRRSAITISLILVLLVSVLGIGSVSLAKKNSDYIEQEAELNKQIELQKSRAEEIDELGSYAQTDDFVKETAEEKLGLVDPNEILFKAVD